MARIVVADDDEQVRSVFRIALEKAGDDGGAAVEGEAALKLCREQPADVAIVDIVMPGKEGIETISQLKTEFPETKIVAISGGGRVGADSYLELARRFGAHRTVAKPIDNQDLLDVVREMLGGSGDGGP